MAKRKNDLTPQDIEKQIDSLFYFFGLYPLVDSGLLKNKFKEKKYSEVVKTMMKIMGLPLHVKIICYSEEKFPEQQAFARIKIPIDLPLIGTPSFSNLSIDLEIRDCLKYDFDKFVAVIAHELSHIILRGSNHELRDSEEATDLCAIIFGFGLFYQKINQSFIKIGCMRFGQQLGYLSNDQREHADSYIERLRRNK